MILKLECVNLSSKDPAALAAFYQKLGAPVQIVSGYEDGWHLGGSEGYVCVWDENRWGRSTAGFVTVVFRVDSLQNTYAELTAKGFVLEPPHQTDWGGEELGLQDPDGNRVIFLE
ncbi:MAG: VOC family protein [Clostridia bacterium]|nr:VOC family protein [Clostridia bacterium]